MYSYYPKGYKKNKKSWRQNKLSQIYLQKLKEILRKNYSWPFLYSCGSIIYSLYYFFILVDFIYYLHCLFILLQSCFNQYSQGSISDTHRISFILFLLFNFPFVKVFQLSINITLNFFLFINIFDSLAQSSTVDIVLSNFYNV